MEAFAFAVLFFLPAAVGNVTPIFINRIPILYQWKTPLDLGVSWRGKRVLGPNKTWRGLLFGTLMGGLAAILLSWFIPFLDFGFTAGCALGFGALMGDAIESFFKRQASIQPGSSWFPFDQIDYIVGGLVCGSLVMEVTLYTALVVLVVYFFVHLVSSYIGYLLKLKDRPI